MQIRSLLPLLLTAVLAFAAGTEWEKFSGPNDIPSHIYRRAEARTSTGDWGSIAIHTPDDTETYGNASMLTAELEFLAGKQLQPPHEHLDEELQYVIEGEGTWFLNGVESPIKPGDMMYTRPWDLHGISNTSDKPLRFLVVKWRGKSPSADHE